MLAQLQRAFCRLAVFATLLASGAVAQADDNTKLQFFETKIRPVLVKHCYECHSAKSKPIQGGLRLDAAEPFRRGGDSGNPLEGEPAETLLIEALNYQSLEMPPTRKLPEAVVKDFEKWIADGAFDPRDDKGRTLETPSVEQRILAGRKEWTFSPPRRGEPANVEDAQWASHWIDRRIQAKWEAKGLLPTADADRTTLARRLHFDLTGLPPKPEELKRFLNDSSPDAVERLVDRLLASPAFGEHWGRMWLDVARYADSNGGDFNATFHDAWRYRNYVVRSFNEDKPFDEFVREQLAGDLMTSDSQFKRSEQLVASGFLMLGPKMLSERDKEKLRMDVVDEQIDTVGRTFLGMTLGCARCHDHKFDPIATQDYYALAGIFRSTQTLDGEIQKYVSNWTRQELPISAPHRQALEAHANQAEDISDELKSTKKAVADAEKHLAETEAKVIGNRFVVDDTDAKTTGKWAKSTHSKPYFGASYVHDEKKEKGSRSIRFEMKLPADGEYEVRVAYAGTSGRAKAVPVVIEHAGGESEVKLNQTVEPKFAPFHPVGTFKFSAAQPAVVTLHNRGTAGFVIADAVEFVPQIKLAEKPAAEQAPLIAARKRLDEAKAKQKKLESQKKQLDKNAPPPRPKALAPQEAKDIGDCRICIRGEHRNLGDSTPRGFLQVAKIESHATIPASTSGRLQLADWITDRQNPLTARVMANRIWKRMLGEGIVRTVDNFGALGEPPSHPELLDELAVEFVDNGWSVKHLVREIALSRTYQLSTRKILEQSDADPENRLLTHAHRKPITAESIRDSILQVSGQLDRSGAESPVAELGTLVTQNRADDKGYEGRNSPRRTLYTPIIRNELPPLLTVFDFADPDFVVGRRASTTTPAQSLLMLNSPFVRDAAVRTAERLASAKSDEDRIVASYELLFAREPTTRELKRALMYIASAQTHPTATEDIAERKKRIREAYTQLTHAMLASTEFRMID